MRQWSSVDLLPDLPQRISRRLDAFLAQSVPGFLSPIERSSGTTATGFRKAQGRLTLRVVAVARSPLFEEGSHRRVPRSGSLVEADGLEFAAYGSVEHSPRGRVLHNIISHLSQPRRPKSGSAAGHHGRHHAKYSTELQQPRCPATTKPGAESGQDSANDLGRPLVEFAPRLAERRPRPVRALSGPDGCRSDVRTQLLVEHRIVHIADGPKHPRADARPEQASLSSQVDPAGGAGQVGVLLVAGPIVEDASRRREQVGRAPQQAVDREVRGEHAPIGPEDLDGGM